MHGEAEPPPAEADDRVVRVTGTVQGVGFRPFVARLAARHGLRGWVRNDGRGVAIRAVGPAAALDRFLADLRAEAPPAAHVNALHVRRAEAGDGGSDVGAGFVIRESETAGETPTVAVTPDLALCKDCRRELVTPGNRRHGYPFLNCTNCGPRYTIVRALPYDRARTTMAAFAMCPACRAEFEAPADRRFHAQPNACADCGPSLEWRDPDGAVLATRGDALTRAAAALRAGCIVAAKGLGGFHLLVDARSESAVAELRRRKHRGEKPFAVMFPSLAALRAATAPTREAEGLLTSPAAPIVLVRRRDGATLAPSVGPGNPWVGAFLPYSPLHVLLLAAVGGPVVATSGNLAEEPLCTDNEEARTRLRGIADFFLVHDREIARPVDDSVVRPRAGGDPVILRRARGYAPAPFELPGALRNSAPLLCVGAHLKSTIAVTAGTEVVVSPHLGDLGNPVTLAAFRREVGLLGSLYHAHFAGVVCDAHPDYASTRFAEALGLPVTRVQHHLAHILACLLEHGGGPERVLGVAWDGTGAGTDGTIWGGEFIIVDRPARMARRCAHLRPFRLPGGEAAVREPRRSAIGVLHDVFAKDAEGFRSHAARLRLDARELALWQAMLDGARHAPVTSSAGRLFDAAAALLGLRGTCSFEGQAGMDLEFAAERAASPPPPWPIPLDPDRPAPWQLDWRPMMRSLVATAPETDVADLSARLHATLAQGILAVARCAGLDTVVLTGGCFQNLVLLEATVAALHTAGFRVLCHRHLPPNDGGIAAGQALAARWGLTTVTAGDTPPRSAG